MKIVKEEINDSGSLGDSDSGDSSHRVVKKKTIKVWVKAYFIKIKIVWLIYFLFRKNVEPLTCLVKKLLWQF